MEIETEELHITITEKDIIKVIEANIKDLKVKHIISVSGGWSDSDVDLKESDKIITVDTEVEFEK